MYPIYSFNLNKQTQSDRPPLRPKEGYLLAGLILYGPMTPGELYTILEAVTPRFRYIEVDFWLGDLWEQGWLVILPLPTQWLVEETINPTSGRMLR